MPRIKRWFHLSQDLNRDPEFREYVKKFGSGGIRFWLEALAILDRTDNFWDLHKGFDAGLLAGTCETKKRIIQRSFEHLKDINWLRVGIDPDQKLFIYAPKWAEYNKRREDKGAMRDTTRYQQGTYPTPSPSPSPTPSPFLKKEIDKEKSLSPNISEKTPRIQKKAMGFLKEREEFEFGEGKPPGVQEALDKLYRKTAMP